MQGPVNEERRTGGRRTRALKHDASGVIAPRERNGRRARGARSLRCESVAENVFLDEFRVDLRATTIKHELIRERDISSRDFRHGIRD